MNNNRILKEMKYWSQVLLLPIYLISFLIPRSKKIWVFGSTFGNRFSDNPKYYYLYVSQYHKITKTNQLDEGEITPKVRPIWITKQRSIAYELMSNGYEAYYSKSFKGIYYCLRGRIYFFDNYSKDICFWLSGGAIKYNFWHGIPLKKIQMDNKFDKVRHPENNLQKIHWKLRRLSDEKPSHYIVTTSDFLKPIFMSAFNTKKVEIYSYPRNEYLRTEKIKNICVCDEQRMLDQVRNDKESNRIILYMPTFRASEDMFFDIVSLDELQRFLEANDLKLVVKLHPKSKLKDKFSHIDENNIIVLNADYDPYPYLKLSDMLITDYSSIYFDFLILNRPIVFFDYDKERYLTESREMYFDYEEFTPGRKAKTYRELENAILDELDKDEWRLRRRDIMDKVMKEESDDQLLDLYMRSIELCK